MSGKVYVLIDHANDRVRGASWETLAMGQYIAAESACPLHALVLGSHARSLAAQVAQKKVDSVLLVEDDKLRDYDPDCHCAALRQVLCEDEPLLLLLAHTYQNIDLAPKLAGSLNKGLITDCIGYRPDPGGFVFIRQMFRNRINAEVRIRSAPPWIVTVQSGAYSGDDLEEGKAEILGRSVDLGSVARRRRSLETIEAMKGKVDLNQAEIIVGVGRGIKKRENLRMIGELAQALGAEIGASRPVVDNDWLERERQIGSSGQNVTPRLYIACGISGAIQHIVGMKNSNCIVAINRDPNAPIFNIAHFGIVGDLFEIVPALTRKLREFKQRP
ncbi:MAG: electron transfer flavoprotein subunit alpha/FixB family protein [Acidobacteriota bacterium]